jgi:CubicO group peptidase (beta-lactamase class C family)
MNMDLVSKKLWGLIVLVLLGASGLKAQLYFPPNSPGTWETATPASAGFDATRLDSVRRWLDQTNSKAFIVLHKGRIVVEWYFDSQTESSLWQWASAGKTITSLAVGIAQKEGFLSINNPSNQYMGLGWTSTTPAQELAITVWHQLTMTSGLEDRSFLTDPFCTESACLIYNSPPNTRWAYHNGPYTLLDSVLEKATGQSLNSYVINKIRNPLGMNGFYLKIDYDNVYFSNARSMARFGLMILADGVWNGTPILNDPTYFQAMITPSQTINPSYGYLWWLNGKSAYRLPQTQILFPGAFAPNAPADMISAIGKDGQIVAVVPSQDLVVIRQGENPGDGSLAPVGYTDSIWVRLNYAQLVTPNDVPLGTTPPKPYRIFPNPTADFITVEIDASLSAGQRIAVDVYTPSGSRIRRWTAPGTYAVRSLPRGVYLLSVTQGNRQWTERLVLE